MLSARPTSVGRSRALVPAAVACGLLWLLAIVGAGLDLSESTLVVVGMAGITLTVALLLLIQAQHNRLALLAATDPLTGLTNHRTFHELLDREIARARLHRYPVSVIVVDLDNFKAINDAHGHPYGDEVLRAVATAIAGTLGDNDHAARIGGEEFALILPGVDGDRAFGAAERARREIALTPVRGIELTCSAGVAVYPSHAEEPATLVQLADSALYWAKRSGKRRTRRFDPDNSPAAWTVRQRTEVESLLARPDPITPVFQPVVSLATGLPVGYEALARFPVAPDRAPDGWFAQAHGCGLGAELEAAAIRAALEPLGRPLDAHLAVNVSPSALGSDAVQEALAGDLTGIVIEITEHELIPEDDGLAVVIGDLRRRGARIAMDDAGAGHAGLKQLIRVRPDIVKLDRALIREIHGDRARTALVESFVRFARDVGATVCAEGIETLDELAVLADLDVQWGQGYVIARPGEPWPEVSPAAAEVCRSTLAETFRSLPNVGHPLGSSDRRLVHLSARLAGARDRDALRAALGLIAAELDASDVCVSSWQPERGVLETLAQSGSIGGDTVFAISDYPVSERALREQEAVQVLVGDPQSDPAEAELLLAVGRRSLLMVPVVAAGESIGIIEAYRPTEAPWSRGQINRARVIANQLAPLIPALTGPGSGAASEARTTP
jgi:diguanylate cyclase (GGDEF)-like protein